jgi:hypothetical protein
MCKIKTSKTETVTYDSEKKVLTTPMNALAEALKLSSYVMEDSSSIMDAKTQEPLIELVKRGIELPTKLLTFSGGKLTKAKLLCAQETADGKYIVLTVLETLYGSHGESERFLGYLVYKA